MNNYQVTFQPEGLVVEVHEGSTVMEALNKAGLEFDFPCGGRGKCGKCRIKIPKDTGAPTTSEQKILPQVELQAGIRLACVTKVYRDVTVELLPATLEHQILKVGAERVSQIDPHFPELMAQLAQEAVTGERPVSPLVGMAFDIGTTTIVGYLLDLATGQELAVVSTLNPQTKFGADVISRVTFADREENGLEQLHETVIEAINKLISQGATQAGLQTTDIYGISIAANTCMHHLFLGISPHSIAVSPYVPLISKAVVENAADLNIKINPAGKVFVLPNIAGFVGADTTAVLLATELDRSPSIKLMIDIGTNGEIALGSKDKIVACSAAAGPAFEGAQISSGMRGALGAIDHIYFEDQFRYSVIGGGKPLGICGSALIDVIAGLLELGIIDKKGRILPVEKVTNPAAAAFKDNLVQHENAWAFRIVESQSTGHGRPILLTQHDVREFQLAKGAMAAGVRILLETYGIQAEDVQEVLLAGAFGNYMNPHGACAIGLIPPVLEDRIKMIGNAAGTGSKLALLSAQEYRRASEIAEGVQFVELGSYPTFNRVFAESMYFKLVMPQ